MEVKLFTESTRNYYDHTFNLVLNFGYNRQLELFYKYQFGSIFRERNPIFMEIALNWKQLSSPVQQTKIHNASVNSFPVHTRFV